jgi:replicative DNA helicase
MSKEIKTLAQEFKLPFIVIVSLRKGDNKTRRAWTEIEIEDFMGTGSIGYDADVAMIASRKNLDNDYDESGLYVKVLKTRNAKLDYNDRFIRFEWNQTRITETFIHEVTTFPRETAEFVEV